MIPAEDDVIVKLRRIEKEKYKARKQSKYCRIMSSAILTDDGTHSHPNHHGHLQSIKTDLQWGQQTN